MWADAQKTLGKMLSFRMKSDRPLPCKETFGTAPSKIAGKNPFLPDAADRNTTNERTRDSK